MRKAGDILKIFFTAYCQRFDSGAVYFGNMIL